MVSAMSCWTACALLVAAAACSRPDRLHLHQLGCPANASCGVGFEFRGTNFAVTCAPVKPSAVDPVVITRGELLGAAVELHRLVGVDDHVLMTVSTPGGRMCDSTPWVIVQPSPQADGETWRVAYCASVDLEKASSVQPDCTDR